MTKGKILQGIWDKLPLERKQRILARAEELEAEYLMGAGTVKSGSFDVGRNVIDYTNFEE